MKFLRPILALLLLGGVAHADGDMFPDSVAALEWPRLFIADTDGTLIEPPDSDTLRHRLNLASCECSQLAPTGGTPDTQLYYELHMTAEQGDNLPGQMWVGSGCDGDTIIRSEQCHQIEAATIPDIDHLNVEAEKFSIPLYDLINATPMTVGQACVSADGGTANVWVLVDTNQDSTPDFFSQRPIALGKFADVTGFDTKPPPLPDNLSASGGENSIEIQWDIPDANATDLYAYQAFCIDPDGNAIPGASKTPLYSTTATICGIDSQIVLTTATVESEDGTAIDTVPSEFANLDTAFLCGTQESGTATSLRIDGLENFKEYKVALVAVDFYGNPTGAFFNRTVIPKPVTDLWEDIHGRGGKIEGGFCSSTGGQGALPGFLIPLGLALAWRRRRKLRASSSVRSNLVRALSLGIVLLAPSISRADDFAPYWEDPSAAQEGSFADAAEHVTWRAGIKVGPYTPDIDAQAGVNGTTGLGPYAAMFGKYFTEEPDGTIHTHKKHVYQVLPVFDLEHVIWSRSGWLGVGGSIGYMQKSAYAYRDDGGTADDLMRLRSTASKNTFRLIPLSITATYRATQLDDLYGIPFVPYVRGGIAYHIWWMKGPSGKLSSVCENLMDDPDDCGSNNKAYGGTFGFTGALGLSIRAERIDSDAARSMRNSGIYHAGFYAELNAAIVNGFGSDTKLSVGDKTWFAGFDFEF